MSGIEVPDKLLVRAGEAKDILGMSREMFRKLVASGTLEAVRLPGLKWNYFRTSDLRAFINKHG